MGINGAGCDEMCGSVGVEVVMDFYARGGDLLE